MIFQAYSFDDFKDRISNGETVICNYMLKAIRKGLSNNYKRVKVFAFEVKDQPGVRFDFFLDKEQWSFTLEGILDAYTRDELYEQCKEVYDLINQEKNRI